MTDFAAFPCECGPIVHEYADGDIAVRVKIDAYDAPLFYRTFTESKEPVFLSNGAEAIEATRGPIMGEYKDGGLAIKLLVAPKDRQRFREIWPKPGLPAVLARQDGASARGRTVDAAAKPALFGHLAKALRTHTAFMGNPQVWRAVGSDADYLAWLREQKCAHCKWEPHWEGDVLVHAEAAHVRRVANGAGTAIKPEYSAIPLCPTRPGVEGCHAAQHRAGEAFLGGKEAVDRLRIQHVQRWVWEALKAKLGYEHWNEVPPSVLMTWAEDHALAGYLPDVYFEGV